MPQAAGSDHDQRLKVLLKEFFEAFFQCFFPAWAARFEFVEIEWLDKELFLAPPQGEKRQLDLVARLRLRPGAPPPDTGTADLVALVHVEIESRASARSSARECWSTTSNCAATRGCRCCPRPVPPRRAGRHRLGHLRDTSGNSGSWASNTPMSVCRPWTGSDTRRVRTYWGWR